MLHVRKVCQEKNTTWLGSGKKHLSPPKYDNWDQNSNMVVLIFIYCSNLAKNTTLPIHFTTIIELRSDLQNRREISAQGWVRVSIWHVRACKPLYDVVGDHTIYASFSFMTLLSTFVHIDALLSRCEAWMQPQHIIGTTCSFDCSGFLTTSGGMMPTHLAKLVTMIAAHSEITAYLAWQRWCALSWKKNCMSCIIFVPTPSIHPHHLDNFPCTEKI